MAARREKAQSRSGASKVVSVIGLVLCVIFAFMLICNLTIIIKGTVSPEKPPSVLGITPMVVLSGSMSSDAPDHIEIGDLIFVDKADPKALAVGDIIAFMEGESVTTHRIINITEEDGVLNFYTKGDANNTEDKYPVTEENLVGVYVTRIPKVGDFALFLRTPLGMLLFIGLPVLAFVIYDIIRRQHLANREEKRRAELEAEMAKLRVEAMRKNPYLDGLELDILPEEEEPSASPKE